MTRMTWFRLVIQFADITDRIDVNEHCDRLERIAKLRLARYFVYSRMETRLGCLAMLSRDFCTMYNATSRMHIVRRHVRMRKLCMACPHWFDKRDRRYRLLRWPIAIVKSRLHLNAHATNTRGRMRGRMYSSVCQSRDPNILVIVRWMYF